MFVAREIKQTLLRKFGKVFFDSPFSMGWVGGPELDEAVMTKSWTSD